MSHKYVAYSFLQGKNDILDSSLDGKRKYMNPKEKAKQYAEEESDMKEFGKEIKDLLSEDRLKDELAEEFFELREEADRISSPMFGSVNALSVWYECMLPKK